MASSYSDLGLELMVTGENAGTWGDKTNSNLNLIQQAVGGYEAITLTSGGTVNLVITDAALSTARNMIIKFATATIAASTICTIPDGIEKFYIFDCSGLTNPANLTIKTVSGTGFSPDAAKIYAAYSDGTNIVEVSLDTLGGTIGSAQLAANSVLSAAISANQITTAKISDNQITTAKISDNQITTAKISDNQITTAKIANDAVGPDQLSNTAVTPGAYTTADITVDAQGRVTAASSGAGGAALMNPVVAQAGPASGSYTAPASVSKYYAVAFSGGGGGGGNHQGWSGNGGGNAGAGFAGMFRGSITPSTNYAYAVGGAGSGSAGSGGNSGASPGNAGGATNVTNLFTANGGNQGNGQSTNTPGTDGSNGNGPGAYSTAISTNVFFTDTRSFAGNKGAGSNQQINPGNPGGAGGLLFYVDEQS
jgi:hypothetical protein